jgi:hypothetical protein
MLVSFDYNCGDSYIRMIPMSPEPFRTPQLYKTSKIIKAGGATGIAIITSAS